MKLPWYLRQAPSVALVAGLGGLFTVVTGALAQPWAATTAPPLGWNALAMSAVGRTLVVAGNESGYCGSSVSALYISTNAGGSWAQTAAPSNWFDSRSRIPMKYLVRLRQQELKAADADYLLAGQVRKGDMAAFEELVEKYKQPIINFATRFLGDPIEAHNVAQNVFVKVLKLAGRFQLFEKGIFPNV